MILEDRVYSVLFVSASEKFRQAITDLLAPSVYSPVHFAVNAGEARRKLLERSYDILIINTPLPDETGILLATDIPPEEPTVVLLFTRGENYTAVYNKVFGCGVFTVRKPISAQLFLQTLDYAKAAREKLRKNEKKQLSLEEKMKEIKIVNKAKWALIKNENLTEDAAHRYIEKQAMNRCVNKRRIAEEILEKYK